MTAKVHLMAPTQFVPLASQRPVAEDFVSAGQHRCHCKFDQTNPDRPKMVVVTPHFTFCVPCYCLLGEQCVCVINIHILQIINICGNSSIAIRILIITTCKKQDKWHNFKQMNHPEFINHAWKDLTPLQGCFLLIILVPSVGNHTFKEWTAAIRLELLQWSCGGVQMVCCCCWVT